MVKVKQNVVRGLLIILAITVGFFVTPRRANAAADTGVSICELSQRATSATTPYTCILSEAFSSAATAYSAITMPGLTFSASAQGLVKIFADTSDTVLSDVIAFANNDNGTATVLFSSGGAMGMFPSQFMALPVITTISEAGGSSSTRVNVALNGGGSAGFTVGIFNGSKPVTSGGGSDPSSPMPEPGTLLLLGSGLSVMGFALRRPWKGPLA
ncbi:MAG TPA: PEP-CTERM sorting domain-containing protein [Candidatus Acidoferrales bacterium]|nr:PEP-CTERM sorting domain-containing protein [Candidatus Acidoferrales bacterium]